MDDFIVAGAGIIGLATARELLTRDPGRSVLVLEKDWDVGLHQSGHTLGVMHSGIFSDPASEKFRLCREGIPLLRKFCDEHDIPMKRVGKTIVAVTENERRALRKLQETKIEAEWLEGGAISDVEPAIKGVAALHLPETSLVDYRAITKALRDDFVKLGGAIRLSSRVRRVTGNVNVETDTESFAARNFINCGGLHADRIASNHSFRIVPIRGEVYSLSPRWESRINGIIRTVSHAEIGLTPTLDGRVIAGPNAVLALAREAYHWNALSVRDVSAMISFPGFWKLAANNVPRGLSELNRSIRPKLFARTIKRYLPEITPSDIRDHESGIRAQVIDKHGNLMPDFIFLEKPGVLHALNLNSPAATAAFAIAKTICDRMKA